MVEIRTPRLLLRPPVARDLEDLHAVFSQPKAMRYWSSLPHPDLETTRRWLEGMIEQAQATGTDFVIEHEGRVVGKAGCYAPPDIGYILHPDLWGQGLATEALSAILDHVLAPGRLDRLRADVDPRNQASLALLARLGFKEVGRATRTWLVGEEWCDSVYLEITRLERV